jgi:hypothetical protein
VKSQWFLRSPRGPGGGGTKIAAAAGVAALCCGVLATAPAVPSQAAVSHVHEATAARPASPDGDGPTGFWYGTDSWPVAVGGTPHYQEPVIGGNYGGYIGMAGNWAHRVGCHGAIAWSSTNSAQANTNFSQYHLGIGTGVYWFMGGPGVDPRYNGSVSEAISWGARQAQWTLDDMSSLNVTYPVVFEDVEQPGIAPAPDNGWDSVYTSSCSGVVKQSYVPVALDRADFNGFADYITSHSSYNVGVYSDPQVWTSIFGTGADSLIPNTYEWTYSSFTSSLSHAPDGWCLRGTSTCAQFFGGDNSSSKYALMWQWSGGGGSRNGYGDFDQIDGNRTPGSS